MTDRDVSATASAEVTAEPLTAEAAFARAALLQREGRTTAAEELYRAVLAREPDHPGALHELGTLRLQAGEFAEAAELFSRLIEREPNSSAHNNRGLALRGLERPSEAAQHFETALALDPERPEANYNLGQALQSLGRRGEARVCYERAIALRPGYAEAHNSLGVLLAPDRPQEALASFQRAVEIRPDFADAYNNMGNVLGDLGRHDEALTNYRRALRIKPDHAMAHNNVGMALRELNRHEEAVSCFEMAQAIKPDYVDAHVNEGLVRLTLGDYATGWKKYAWRRLTASFSQGRKNPPRPLWLGQWDIAGKTILLHGEQGLGDTIQFCRYVPHVAQQGARIILAVQRPLASLMTGLPGVSVLRVQGEPIPPFDGYCPLPSLPLAFKTTLQSIPANVPYLSAPVDRVERWRPIFDEIGRPRIGLMWAGAAGTAHNRRRSIPLRLLASLLDFPDFQFVALQKELPEDDRPLLHTSRMMSFLGERQTDLADAAAMISMLDLVITIDTSIAHLAGAMGKQVWVLLPFSADWRWLRARNDTPWYPNARLFRQPAPGDWESVVIQVGRSLQIQSFRSPAGSLDS